ncbi:MAG: topoisomerase IV, partial [Oscillospiraceae bacterium]|nr:topoisomerase IV [Oscillospiraceae bacterium]
YDEDKTTADYAVNLFLTADGYLKKITPQSLRTSGVQKLKENDKIVTHLEITNNTDLLFFSNKAQVYKTNLSKFNDSKASLLGDYLPAKLNFDDGEKLVGMVATKDYSGHILFFFQNGKLAKVTLSSYMTKTNRKKLANAYSSLSPLCAMFQENVAGEYLIVSSNQKYLIVNSLLINSKSTRNSQGISVMKLNKDCFVKSVTPYTEGMINNSYRFRTKNLPARGAVPKLEDVEEQLKL